MSKSNNKSSKSNNKSSKSNNKSSKSSDKPLSLKEMFNLEFMMYLLMIAIPVTLFFNTVLDHKTLGDMTSLFFVTCIVTGAVLYKILKNKKQTLEGLGNKSAVIFTILLGIIILVLLVRRMFKENIYTLNGAVFFAIFVLILVILYNFVQILLGLS
jgi:hypothetical protein